MGGTRNDFVRSAVPGTARSIVDIGSGEGWTLGEFRHVPRRVGVDTDLEVLERARARYPDCDFRPIDGGRLPFGDGDFDVAVLAEVLEHVGEENKQIVVDEALRVLRDTGLLIVTVPHAGLLSFLDPLDFKRRLPRLYGLYRRRAGGTPQTAPEIGHKHLSVAELDRLFGGRVVYERLSLSGWLSPFFDLAQAVCTALPFVPERAVWRLGAVKARDSGVPAPRFVASHLRVVARKLPQELVQDEALKRHPGVLAADGHLDGPSQLREAEASTQAQAPLRPAQGTQGQAADAGRASQAAEARSL